MYKIFFSLIFISLFAGCASTPEFDTTRVDRSLTPANIINKNNIHMGKSVLWGGTILDTRNLKEATQIEVLAYPLNSSHRPELDKQPLGRFVLIYPGYLESKIYIQGKQLSALGKVIKTRQAKIGESTYTYPTISANKIHLWVPKDKKSNTSFHFGIGIGL